MSNSENREFPTRPLVGVAAVVWHNDFVLLVKRGKEPESGSWSLPGGAQELGETLANAIHREVFEETSVRISKPMLVDTVDLIQKNPSGKIQYHYSLIEFTAYAMGTDIKSGTDASDARWVHFDECPNYLDWQRTMEIIEKSKSCLIGKK